MPICSSLQYYIYVWNLAREINDDLKPFVLLGAAAFRWSMWLHLHRNDLVLRKKIYYHSFTCYLLGYPLAKASYMSNPAEGVFTGFGCSGVPMFGASGQGILARAHGW